MKDIPIASVVTVSDDPTNGSAVFLVIHEVLYFGDRIWGPAQANIAQS
jgi:hypothetical protein